MRYENGQAIVEGPKVLHQPKHTIVVELQRASGRGVGERVRVPREGPRFNAVCVACHRFASGSTRDEAYNRLNETPCKERT